MFTDQLIPLPDDVFRLLRDFIHDYCGIFFDDGSKFLLERRLSRRLEQHRLRDFGEYYHFLRYDRRREEELTVLIDNLTTNETYFFREEQQLKSFSEEILPEIAASKGNAKSLRIWSAGCSTGEEPYTISMLLQEKQEFKDWTIEIFATDISQRVLQSARRGIYQPIAFRTTDPKYVSKYFKKEDDVYRISDTVRKNVVFLHLNLVDANKLAFINPMDIIFCRNVIIYFDLASKKKVVDIFHAKLKDNGYLLLGHSESLINISTAYALRHLKHDMVYQKLQRSPAAP